MRLCHALAFAVFSTLPVAALAQGVTAADWADRWPVPVGAAGVVLVVVALVTRAARRRLR